MYQKFHSLFLYSKWANFPSFPHFLYFGSLPFSCMHFISVSWLSISSGSRKSGISGRLKHTAGPLCHQFPSLVHFNLGLVAIAPSSRHLIIHPFLGWSRHRPPPSISMFGRLGQCRPLAPDWRPRRFRISADDEKLRKNSSMCQSFSPKVSFVNFFRQKLCVSLNFWRKKLLTNYPRLYQ